MDGTAIGAAYGAAAMILGLVVATGKFMNLKKPPNNGKLKALSVDQHDRTCKDRLAPIEAAILELKEWRAEDREKLDNMAMDIVEIKTILREARRGGGRVP